MAELSKILEKIDPKVFTPEVQKELTALLEAKRIEADEAGFARGLKAAEGKVQLLESTAAAKAEETDKDHAAKLQQVIEKLNEQKTSALENLDSEHTALLEKVLGTIDEKHTVLLEKVLSDIDRKHSKALAMVVEKIDTDHTKKLLDVKQMYESKFEGRMVKAVDQFLDTYLAESTPEQKLVDITRLAKLTEAVDQIKKILVVNEEYVQTEIKEAVEDAQGQMDALRARIDTLMTEKIEMKQKIDGNEARKVLAEMASALPAKKKLYVEKLFESANVEEIKAGFDEACKAYDKEDENTRKRLIEENKGAGVAATPPPAETQPLMESSTAADPTMNAYVGAFNRSLSAKK